MEQPPIGDTVLLPAPAASSRRLVPVDESATLEERLKAAEGEIEKLHLLLNTVENLGAETNLYKLVDLIAQSTSRIMNCERSSLFLANRNTEEVYSLVAQGLDHKEIRLPMSAGLVGYVARSGKMVNVPDAYQDSRFNPAVDQRTGFRTRSVLAMPLQDRGAEVTGVLQCLNKMGDSPAGQAFTRSDERFLSALANLFAVFLENAKLYRRTYFLFQSFVTTMSRSIDARDPCTSGHSRRVTLYTINLARAVHESKDPPFAEIRYTRERLRQLRYAGLLHDVGKIGVREYILCKAEKLTPGGWAVLEGRLRLLRAERKSALLEQALAGKQDFETVLKPQYEAFAREIEEALEVAQKANKAGYLDDQTLARLTALKDRGLLTDQEFADLSIRRGNLTPPEWVDMRAHVTKSYELLRHIPWPDELADVPEIAYTHHEKVDGSGYPRGLKDVEIHFDGRIMCVADIYDALTASDRPYKKAISHEKARAILMEEAAAGKLMPELVTLFFEKQCHVLPEDAGLGGATMF